MFAITNSPRRGSAIFGGVLLAALLTAADLAGPTVSAAQASAAHRVLLGQFDPGIGAAVGGWTGSAGATDAPIPAAERALLGRVEATRAETPAERRVLIGPVVPRGGEQALLGRRGGAAS